MRWPPPCTPATTAPHAPPSWPIATPSPRPDPPAAPSPVSAVLKRWGCRLSSGSQPLAKRWSTHFIAVHPFHFRHLRCRLHPDLHSTHTPVCTSTSLADLTLHALRLHHSHTIAAERHPYAAGRSARIGGGLTPAALPTLSMTVARGPRATLDLIRSFILTLSSLGPSRCRRLGGVKQLRRELRQSRGHSHTLRAAFCSPARVQDHSLNANPRYFQLGRRPHGAGTHWLRTPTVQTT